MSNELHFYNNYHLGDMGYHIHFCNKLILQYPDLMIYNYTKDDYIDELNHHIYPSNKDNILIKSLKDKPKNSQNCWINRNWEYEKWRKEIFHYGNFDFFYIDFYKHLFGELGFESPVNSIDDFLFDHSSIIDFSNDVDNYDFLLINSEPFSGQWFYSERDFDQLIHHIRNSGYTVITTKKSKVDGIPCTLDYDYSLLQIGSQAIKSKYVIGVHTSPWLYSLNKYSVDNVNLFICLQNQGVTYSLDNVFSVKADFNDVYKILKRKGIVLWKEKQ